MICGKIIWLILLAKKLFKKNIEIQITSNPKVHIRIEVIVMNNQNNHKLDGNKIDIFYIIEYEDMDSYKKYIANYDINIRNVTGASLLQLAIAAKKRDIAFDLLSRSIDVNNQDRKGATALHWISDHPDLLLAEQIIKKGGRLDIVDVYGNTPLWSLVVKPKKEYEIIQLFINHGADPTIENKANRSPIYVAKQIKNEKLLKILQKEISIPIEHP
jgi:uncharacterized protein